MRTAGELVTPRLDERAVGPEDTDRGTTNASLPDGVGDVDATRCILRETVGVPERQPLGRRQPVVRAVPPVRAFAEHEIVPASRSRNRMGEGSGRGQRHDAQRTFEKPASIDHGHGWGDPET